MTKFKLLAISLACLAAAAAKAADGEAIGFVDAATGSWQIKSKVKNSGNFQGWKAAEKGLCPIEEGDLIICQPNSKVRLFLTRAVYVLSAGPSKPVTYDTRTVPNVVKPELTYSAKQGATILSGASKTFGLAKGVGVIWPVDGITFYSDDVRLGLDRQFPSDATFTVRGYDGETIFQTTKLTDLAGNALDPAGIQLTLPADRLKDRTGDTKPLTYKLSYTIDSPKGSRKIDLTGRFFVITRLNVLDDMRVRALKSLDLAPPADFASFPGEAFEYIGSLKELGLVYEQWSFLKEAAAKTPVMAGLLKELCQEIGVKG